MSARVPTPIDDLLDALEERMGIEHVTSGDTFPSQRSHVAWSRSSGIAPQPLRFGHDGQQTIARHAHAWEAMAYAATDLEVSNLLKQLHGHVDNIKGPRGGTPADGDPGDDDYAPETMGYDVAAGKAPQGGDGVAAGYAGSLIFTFYESVAAQIYGSKAPTSVTVDAQATDTDGSGAETGASIEVSS
jgi:hypothetical protein